MKVMLCITILQICTIKCQPYDVWLLRNRVQQTEFFVTIQKINILKNCKKTPKDIIIL